MTVYIEVIFLSNLAINALIVYLTMLALRLQINKPRLFLSAVIGALFSAIYPFIGSYGNITRIFLAIIYPVMIKRIRNAKEYITVLCVFLGISFTLAGAVLCANGFSTASLSFSPITYGLFPIIFCPSAIACIALINRLVKGLAPERTRNTNVYDAVVFNENCALKVRAYYDTGNRVYANNGECVVFLSGDIYNKLLPATESKVMIQTVADRREVATIEVYIEIYLNKGANKIYKAKAGASLRPLGGYGLLLHSDMLQQ